MNPAPSIAVIGLGYVGLPLALAFAKRFSDVVGFDVNARKVAQLQAGIDVIREGIEEEIRSSSLRTTSNVADLSDRDFFVVAVPTPVDSNHTPDLSPLRSACETLGPILKPGSTIVFESTVYPGVTEEICGPLLAQASGLRAGIDFKLGYSPERINPGDKLHTLEKVVKIVAGQDADALDLIASVYGAVVTAGVHRASSIKVAEAAKVIENTQRDLNIALMNELALIFDKMQISSRDVLDAAATKWNFLRFSPGLVGGHCIGVDPYYLTTKAQQLGYHPQVILSGRRINDGMGTYIAQRTVKLLATSGFQVRGAKVGILGLTFKENIADVRNSRVPEIVKELREFGVDVVLHDPQADPHETFEEYGINLDSLDAFQKLDGLMVAVAHDMYREMSVTTLRGMLKERAIFVDVKSLFSGSQFDASISYWSL